MRPQCIDQYIQYNNIEKQAKDEKARLRPEVETLLKVGNYDGITFSEFPKQEINQEVFLGWAFENLEKEDYESLFAKVFDPNMVGVLVTAGKIKLENLPAGWQTTKMQSRITVSSK